MIEPKVYVRVVNRDVGVMLGHFFRADPKTSDRLRWPHYFDVACMQRNDQFSKRRADRLQVRRDIGNNVFKITVSWVRWHCYPSFWL